MGPCVELALAPGWCGVRIRVQILAHRLVAGDLAQTLPFSEPPLPDLGKGSLRVAWGDVNVSESQGLSLSQAGALCGGGGRGL